MKPMRTLAFGLGSVLVSLPALAAEERPVLELSLDQAVERALENNVDIIVEHFSPEFAAANVKAAKGPYDVAVTATVGRISDTTPARTALTGGDSVETDLWNYNFGARKLFGTGTLFDVAFDNQRGETNNVFATFNPSFASTLTATLTQPLLRNAGIDSTRRQLRVAKNNHEISDAQFRQVVINTLASVKRSYYDVIFAIDNLKAQQKSLALAQKLLDENRIKVRVGTMAPLDVVAAESEVAGRDESVIVAENGLAEAEDALKRAIFQQNDPQMWALRVVPTDRPAAEPVEVDINAAVERALERRLDLQIARKSLDNNEIDLKLARNQMLPALDLVGSYQSTGQGGTQIRDATGQLLIDPIAGGYGDALSDVFSRDFPTWSLSLNVTYPLANRQASAQKARAQIARDQARAALRRQELAVAAQVRTAARAVQTNFKRVESTRAASTLQARRLDAEEKRFAAGMSTNFLVTQAQRDLAFAEVAEVRAVADYHKSVIDFERVQEASISSSGSSLTIQ